MNPPDRTERPLRVRDPSSQRDIPEPLPIRTYRRRRATVIVGVLLLVVAFVIAVRACGGSEEPSRSPTTSTTQVSARSTTATLLTLDTQFSNLSQLVSATGLDDVLAGKGPITMLAPSDLAFPTDGPRSLEGLLADPDAAKALLSDQILEGSYTTNDLVELDGKTVRTVGGHDLEVHVVDGRPTVAGVAIAKSDIVTANGMLQVVNELPAEQSTGGNSSNDQDGSREPGSD